MNKEKKADVLKVLSDNDSLDYMCNNYPFILITHLKTCKNGKWALKICEEMNDNYL